MNDPATAYVIERATTLFANGAEGIMVNNPRMNPGACPHRMAGLRRALTDPHCSVEQ